MANTYKNIVITPAIGSNTIDPKIVFSGGNSSVNTDVTLYVYPTSNGTLSVEGSAGQLLTVTNDLSNTLFAVNDVSGLTLMAGYANGLVSLAQAVGNVGISNTTPAHKLSVNGTAYFLGNVTVGNSSVNSSVFSNSSGVYFGGTALTANNANNLNGKAEAALNVNSAVTVTTNTSTNTFQIGTGTYSIASGNVGIGNSAPADKLSVNGTTYLGGNVTIVANVQVGNSSVYPHIISNFGYSNPNTFGVGTLTTNASLNTLLVGPYTIASGNTLTITTGSRVVIV